MSYVSNDEDDRKKFRFGLSAGTVRAFAIQLLFLGLLFLPDYSLFRKSFEAENFSRVVHVLAQIMGNPAFYLILMICAVIYSFSFRMNIDDVTDEGGNVSVGQILFRSLLRIVGLYTILFILSWLFLTYKLMFMGNVYINPVVFRAL